MGITYTRDDEKPVANQRVVTAEATFDGDYTAGGEPLEPADVGLGQIESVTVQTNVTTSGFVPSHDGGTLALYDNETGAEAAAAEADGDTVTLEVRGRS
ncbi:hypothetical protein GCM10009646_78800 [Streptomyces aureus]